MRITPMAEGATPLDRAKMVVGDQLCAACNDAELAQIQDWIDRQQSLSQLKAEYAAETLAEQMHLARKWFKAADPNEVRAIAEEVRAAWASLRVAMGMKRPKARPGEAGKKSA
jgi:hypothetical protein